MHDNERIVEMRLVGLLVVVAFVVGVPAALAEGSDPNGKATFVSPIKVSGKAATLSVRYQCASGEALWVSAKQTKSGVSAARLQKEGASKAASAWWDSHRNRFVCNGKPHTGTFTIDKVEPGKKGTLVPGTAWVQFCVTTGHTEKTTVLILSKSGWVHVTA
jgi:hypothetical protein